MRPSKPLMANSTGTDSANAAVQSALRTLEAEGGGIAAIEAALRSDLGEPFARAADLIRSAKGRLIVTGLGKSGLVGRKISATFASTGTPALFLHTGEALHGEVEAVGDRQTRHGGTGRKEAMSPFRAIWLNSR